MVSLTSQRCIHHCFKTSLFNNYYHYINRYSQRSLKDKILMSLNQKVSIMLSLLFFVKNSESETQMTSPGLTEMSVSLAHLNLYHSPCLWIVNYLTKWWFMYIVVILLFLKKIFKHFFIVTFKHFLAVVDILKFSNQHRKWQSDDNISHRGTNTKVQIKK